MGAIDEIKAALGDRFNHQASYAVLPPGHADTKRYRQVCTLDSGMVVVDTGAAAEPAKAPPPAPKAEPAKRFGRAVAPAAGEE